MNSRPIVTATTDMTALPGVLGCRPLRRTVQVRQPIPRYRGTVARWHSHLRGLATAIHETSGLNKVVFSYLLPFNRKTRHAKIGRSRPSYRGLSKRSEPAHEN